MTKWPYLMAGTRKEWLYIWEEYQVIEWSAINFNSIIFLTLLYQSTNSTGKLKKFKRKSKTIFVPRGLRPALCGSSEYSAAAGIHSRAPYCGSLGGTSSRWYSLSRPQDQSPHGAKKLLGTVSCLGCTFQSPVIEASTSTGQIAWKPYELLGRIAALLTSIIRQGWKN